MNCNRTVLTAVLLKLQFFWDVTQCWCQTDADVLNFHQNCLFFAVHMYVHVHLHAHTWNITTLYPEILLLCIHWISENVNTNYIVWMDAGTAQSV